MPLRGLGRSGACGASTRVELAPPWTPQKRWIIRLLGGVLLAGCGLASKDFDVSEPFQAGGGPPTFTGNFQASTLTGPLSADVSKISSITLKAARIEATDNVADLSFISGAIITIGGTQVATLPSPPPAGQASVQLQVDSSKELKPFIQNGSTLSATINYSPTPITARSLQLTLTIHGSLL
jgi:hypothetical protein